MHKNYICIDVHLIFHHVVYITSASEHQHTCNKSFIFSWLAEGMHSHWFPCFNWSWLTATGRHHTQYSSRSINSHTHTHTHTTYPRQSPQILQKKSVFPPHRCCCIQHKWSLTLPPTVTHSLYIHCRGRDQLTYMWSYLFHITIDLFLFQHYPL